MAVVNAQARAALSTINFVESVGFDENGTCIYATFDYNVTNSTTGEINENTISVPFLTIVPIPFLRVQEVTVNFNAKISSVTSASTTSNTTSSVVGSLSAHVGGFSASMTASYSNQVSEANSNTEQREFSMSIYVHASQAELPAGTAKLLSILEEAIMISLRSANGVN